MSEREHIVRDYVEEGCANHHGIQEVGIEKLAADDVHGGLEEELDRADPTNGRWGVIFEKYANGIVLVYAERVGYSGCRKQDTLLCSAVSAATEHTYHSIRYSRSENGAPGHDAAIQDLNGSFYSSMVF
jgi:hypothetical protein